MQENERKRSVSRQGSAKKMFDLSSVPTPTTDAEKIQSIKNCVESFQNAPGLHGGTLPVATFKPSMAAPVINPTADSLASAPLPDDLQAVIESWPTLPKNIRAAVVALVGVNSEAPSK
jgi:hypothetical protein